MQSVFAIDAAYFLGCLKIGGRNSKWLFAGCIVKDDRLWHLSFGQYFIIGISLDFPAEIESAGDAFCAF
jgi:hypothetical protein